LRAGREREGIPAARGVRSVDIWRSTPQRSRFARPTPADDARACDAVSARVITRTDPRGDRVGVRLIAI
jgi:hypothetical protein